MLAQYAYLSSDFLWGDVYGQANAPSLQSSGVLVLGPPELVMWSRDVFCPADLREHVWGEGRG